MPYQYGVNSKERALALAGAIALAAALLSLLALGLNVERVQKIAQSITAIAIPLSAPVPPITEPQQKPSEANSGRAAPPNIKSKAAPREAPKPIIKIPKVTKMPAALKAEQGTDSRSGAAAKAGEGSGAGGQGDGLGSGTSGSGLSSISGAAMRAGFTPMRASNSSRRGDVDARISAGLDTARLT